MRQRITFVQKAENSIDPAKLQVTDKSISTSSLIAAREDRITFGFDELPQELCKVLKSTHQIHVRWVAEKAYEGIGPLVGRLSPGLHVFYTPQRGNDSPLLCPLLKKVFGDLDCISPAISFTTLPTERFSHSASTQYYSPLSSVRSLELYLNARVCKNEKTKAQCLDRVKLLQQATSIDIDFDTIAHAVTLSAYTPPQTWSNIDIKQLVPESRLEVGVLSVSKPVEPEELSLGGFLTVIGEHTKPTATLFSFPSRHHSTTQHFKSSYILPTGLHPTLELKINGTKPPVDERTCSLHTHLTLPRQIFADKYQLSDRLFLGSKNLTALHFSSSPVDLEAPAYAVNLWGSSVLLELAPPSSSADVEWTAQIPLHLRYLAPNSNSSGQAPLETPYPAVFWACTAEEGSKFNVNPFDRVNLGYDGLFGPRTMFYHVSPQPSAVVEGERLISKLSVPVLDLDRAWYVESGTAAAVLLGLGWVLWSLFGVWWREGYGSGRGEEGAEGKKKQ